MSLYFPNVYLSVTYYYTLVYVKIKANNKKINLIRNFYILISIYLINLINETLSMYGSVKTTTTYHDSVCKNDIWRL